MDLGKEGGIKPCEWLPGTQTSGTFGRFSLAAEEQSVIKKYLPCKHVPFATFFSKPKVQVAHLYQANQPGLNSNKSKTPPVLNETLL